MGMVFKVIGGLIAIGLIWLFQLIVAVGLFVGYLFLLRLIGTALGLDIDSKTISNIGIGLGLILTLATMLWLERKSRRYGLDFLFTWLPF